MDTCCEIIGFVFFEILYSRIFKFKLSARGLIFDAGIYLSSKFWSAVDLTC